jgi:SH3-like domain-containing protein
MKTNKLFYRALVAAWLIAAASVAADSSKMMSVQVKTAPLRDSPSFIGKAGPTLSFGDRVEITDTQGPWSKVSAPGGLTGWVHTSALSSKKIVLKSGQETAQAKASSDELALAGKGFNSDVEGEFKKQHQNIDFKPIDKMEKTRVSAGEMQAFLKEGAITPMEGGAK